MDWPQLKAAKWLLVYEPAIPHLPSLPARYDKRYDKRKRVHEHSSNWTRALSGDDARIPRRHASSPSLPAALLACTLDAALIEKVCDYARRTHSGNTGRAYGVDWRAYAPSCRKRDRLVRTFRPMLLTQALLMAAREAQLAVSSSVGAVLVGTSTPGA